MSERNLRAYLYPNPPLEGPTLENRWGDEYEMVNKPSLEIELRNFSSGNYVLRVIEPVELEKEVDIDSERRSVLFEDDGFSDPGIEEVEVEVVDWGSEEEYILPTPTHKISGRVTDFDGNDFPAYLWADGEPGNAVKTRKDGSFEFYYPEGRELRLFVDDESYHKETLESWINAQSLEYDLEINPRIGEFELRSFRAWETLNKIFIFFVPASVRMEVKGSSYTEESMKYVDLTREDIEGIWINDEEGEIEKMTKHVMGGFERNYPSYILTVDVKTEKIERPVVVRAVVNSEKKGKGEAYFIL